MIATRCVTLSRFEMSNSWIIVATGGVGLRSELLSMKFISGC